MATEQVIEERVLDIFKGHIELMAEEVFPLYEEAYGETSRSNSIHTTISRLMKKGLLYVVRRQTSPITNKTVNVWKYNDGAVVHEAFVSEKKLSNNQLKAENDLLLARNKGLEEANMKLLGMIEKLREEIDNFHKDAAGVDL